MLVSTSTFAAPINGSVQTSPTNSSESNSIKSEPVDLHRASLKVSELSKNKVQVESTVNSLGKSIADSKKKFNQCQLQLDSVTKLKQTTFVSPKLAKLKYEFEKAGYLINIKNGLMEKLLTRLNDTELSILSKKEQLKQLVKGMNPKQRYLEISSFEEIVEETATDFAHHNVFLSQLKYAVENDQKQLKTLCSKSQAIVTQLSSN